MVKDSLAYLKNNQMAKNEMGMGNYSLRYHTHKISRLYARKIIKGAQLNFKKGCFMELNCLAIKIHKRIYNDVSIASLPDCYIPSKLVLHEKQ